MGRKGVGREKTLLVMTFEEREKERQRKREREGHLFLACGKREIDYVNTVCYLFLLFFFDQSLLACCTHVIYGKQAVAILCGMTPIFHQTVGASST